MTTFDMPETTATVVVTALETKRSPVRGSNAGVNGRGTAGTGIVVTNSSFLPE